MNKTRAEASRFANKLVDVDNDRDPRIQRFVIPPYTLVQDVAATLASTSVKVGAQNMHWSDRGAWTGEISPLMLVDCGMQMVELGHSERREHFNETNDTVGLKTEAAVRHGLIPLICIGETRSERDSGSASEVLGAQIHSAFEKLSSEQKSAPVLLAYEPVWAIGDHGSPATPDYADARHAEIAKIAEDIMGHKILCLYGGSVNSENCVDLIRCPHIDGLFIGRSAWQVEGYLDILSKSARAL